MRGGVAAAVAACVLVAGCATETIGGTAKPAETVVETPESESAELLADKVEPDGPGCVAAVGRQGRLVWAGSRGLANLRAEEELRTSALFDIGQVTMQFTAGAVLLLAQDGKLRLTDPVSAYVPGLPPWAAETTLESLIHHTSGIPELYDRMEELEVPYDEPFSHEQAVRMIAEFELDRTRGEHSFSSSNYVLLADVVRLVSGSSFPDFLRQRFFEPLDLDMIVAPTGDHPGLATAYFHDDSAGGSGYVDFGRLAWEIHGDTGILASAPDLVRWADNYRTGEVGGRSFLDAQLAGAVRADLFEYAAGLLVRDDGSLTHDGYVSGFVADFEVSADREVAVAVVCNHDLTHTMARALLRIWT
jgi:CubicO group peptidase (beta-lactamase class C family)